MSLQNFYNLIDIYGYNPKLFIDGYSKNGTLIGSILTLITYLFFILIFIYYLYNLFFDKTLTVISSTRTATLNDTIIMNKNNFYFAFALEDKNYNLYIDEQIYYPEIFYKRGVRKHSTGQFDYNDTTQFELDSCNINQFGDEFKDLYSSFPLKNMYCIKNLNHTLKGGFSDNEYSFIIIKIYKCNNNTKKKKDCKIKKEIDEKLDGALFTFQYQNYIFNPNNYSNPFKPILGDFMTTISQKYFKELYVYLKKFSLTTDKGLIFENKIKKELCMFDYSNDLMSFQSKEHLFQLTFRMSTNVNEISRSYIKAQTFFSYIGGFKTFIDTIFVFIKKFIIKYIIYEKIINKIFFYKSDGDYINKKEKLFKKNIKNKNESNLNFDSNIKLNNKSFNINSINKNGKNLISNENILEKSSNQKSLEEDLIKINNLKEKIINSNNLIYYTNNYKKNKLSHIIQNTNISINILYKLTKKYKVRISYFKKIFYCCFSKNKDLFFYKKGVEIIKQKLDIISIIKEFFNLELIKKINFTEEQIFLLNYYIKNNLVKFKYFNKKENKNNFIINEKINRSLNNLIYYDYNNKEKNINLINNYLLDIFINKY